MEAKGKTLKNAKARIEARSGVSAGPKHGCLNVGARNPQESGRKAPLSCNAAFAMLQCSFSLAAAQLLVKMTSALQKSECCSATSAAQHSENCSATSVSLVASCRSVGRHLVGVWIGGVWNGHFPESEKYFSEAEFSRKIPEIPQKERFLPNFRLRNLKIQSPKNCNSIPPAIPYPH